MTIDNSGYHRAVAAELDRQRRKGYDARHDDEHGVDHLLEIAFKYISEGNTVKGGAMIIAARGLVQRSKGKNSMQRDIEEFMERADQHVALYPQLPEEHIKILRIRLMVEELLGAVDPNEFLLDENGHIRQDIGAYVELLIKNKSNELIASMLNGDLVGVADGLADVLYVVIGTAVAYGINIQEVFDEVHRSNLSKTVWDEEQGRYTIEKDEFGKGIKPPTYSPAELEPIVLRQIEDGQRYEAYLAEVAASEDENASVVVGTIEV